jgi:hypothetical protein
MKSTKDCAQIRLAMGKKTKYSKDERIEAYKKYRIKKRETRVKMTERNGTKRTQRRDESDSLNH